MTSGTPERHGSTVDVHLVLRRNGRILLGQRQNTGFADGQFHLPAGHLEQGESVVAAVIREAQEELGVEIDADDLRFLHVMHNGDGGGRIGLFFEVRSWRGTPENREPEKCRCLDWFSLERLPTELVPYARTALEQALVHDEALSVVGWA